MRRGCGRRGLQALGEFIGALLKPLVAQRTLSREALTAVARKAAAKVNSSVSFVPGEDFLTDRRKSKVPPAAEERHDVCHSALHILRLAPAGTHSTCLCRAPCSWAYGAPGRCPECGRLRSSRCCASGGVASTTCPTLSDTMPARSSWCQVRLMWRQAGTSGYAECVRAAMQIRGLVDAYLKQFKAQ